MSNYFNGRCCWLKLRLHRHNYFKVASVACRRNVSIHQLIDELLENTEEADFFDFIDNDQFYKTDENEKETD